LSDGYIYCLIGTSHLGKKWIMNEIVALMIICPLMVMVGLGGSCRWTYVSSAD